jgi:zinc protease
MRAVRREDVMDVFRRYVQDRPCVTTSFVPRGRPELAVAGAERAEVYDEPITAGGEHEEVSQGEEAAYERTTTRHDRSEPPLGETPLLRVPEPWQARLGNGVRVLGIEHAEVPLVSFDLTLRGGHWLDPPAKAGVANLLAQLLMEGTAHRTPVELEEAIGLLGAEISIEAGQEEIRITGSTLARNLEPTLALVEEILLEPRWDETEYARLERELEVRLRDREARPIAVAFTAFYRLLYGDDHILGTPREGTLETTSGIELADLQEYYERNVSPAVATFHVVGDVDRERVLAALVGLGERWRPREVRFPEYRPPLVRPDARLFFIDVPDAKQSTIVLGRLALSGADPDHNNLDYANERLGGGSSGRLFQLLRIEKGYTYGVYSFLGETQSVAPFAVYGSVRSNVTLESLQLMRRTLREYRDTYTVEEMEVTKNQLVKANTRAFESLGAKRRMLQRMSKFGLPADFAEREQRELLAMELDDFHELIERHLDEDDMIYVVVGDARTQLDRVAGLGLGPATLLDVHGAAIQ